MFRVRSTRCGVTHEPPLIMTLPSFWRTMRWPLIAWKTVENASVESAGTVRFVPERNGTRVDVSLTYNPPLSALRDREIAMQSRVSQLTGEMGEPFISLFTPVEAETLLRRCGFGAIEHFGPKEAIRTYFVDHPDVRLDVPQRLLVATVGPR